VNPTADDHSSAEQSIEEPLATRPLADERISDERMAHETALGEHGSNDSIIPSASSDFSTASPAFPAVEHPPETA